MWVFFSFSGFQLSETCKGHHVFHGVTRVRRSCQVKMYYAGQKKKLCDCVADHNSMNVISAGVSYILKGSTGMHVINTTVPPEKTVPGWH